MVDQVMKDFGRIDILMNMAGTNARFSAGDMPPEEYEKVVRSTCLGRSCPARPWAGS